jgi:class 3 adenylate cyclase
MPTALRTYLFTDILGYGALLRTKGDAAAARLLRNYRRIITAEMAKARGGTIQEMAGDTVYAAFRTPVDAVNVGVAIVRAIDRYNERSPATEIRIGLAIHAGESVRQGGDFVGSSVALASQLAHAGRHGQILVTGTVHGLLRTSDVPPMIDLGVWGPHGIGQTVHVYEVVVPDRKANASDGHHPRRLLAVLFTDIARSTDRAVEVGDRGWGDIVERHHATVRRQLELHHGIEIDTAGDGFFATFDSPSRAIGCALTIRDEIHAMGLEVREGIHVGECEIIAGKVGGIAVVVGARTREAAEPGEVLTTQTVRDIVAGGDFSFSARGVRSLKGIPGRWRLYTVEAGPPRQR